MIEDVFIKYKVEIKIDRNLILTVHSPNPVSGFSPPLPGQDKVDIGQAKARLTE